MDRSCDVNYAAVSGFKKQETVKQESYEFNLTWFNGV